MISDPNSIFYACIAHKSTILFEFNSSDSSLQTLAHQCLNQTPQHHSIFSHTTKNRAFTFLIDDPFVFFAIFDPNLDYPDRISFLNRLKNALDDLIRDKKSKNGIDFSSCCFQGDLHPVFHRLVSKSFDLDEWNKENNNGSNDDGSRRNSSSGSVKDGSRRVMSKPLLPNGGDGLKKKRKLFGDLGCVEITKDMVLENNADLGTDGHVMVGSKDVVVCQKGVGLCLGDGDRQRARRIWRKHVWVLLVLDLVVCLILLGIWLWICQGFRCIEG